MTNWTEMVDFLGVDLERSSVVRWHTSDKALVVELKGVLLPIHSAYERPLPESTECCKPARVVFPFPREVRGLKSMKEASAPLGPDVSDGFGAIRDLTLHKDGSYEISGAFGEVAVQSMAVRFEVTSQKQCGS